MIFSLKSIIYPTLLIKIMSFKKTKPLVLPTQVFSYKKIINSCILHNHKEKYLGSVHPHMYEKTKTLTIFCLSFMRKRIMVIFNLGLL